jgi:hypothetical protein
MRWFQGEKEIKLAKVDVAWKNSQAMKNGDQITASKSQSDPYKVLKTQKLDICKIRDYPRPVPNCELIRILYRPRWPDSMNIHNHTKWFKYKSDLRYTVFSIYNHPSSPTITHSFCQ